MLGNKVEKAFSDWPINRVAVKKRYVDITGNYPGPNHILHVCLLGMAVCLPAQFLVHAFIGPVLGLVAGAGFWLLLEKKLRIRISEDTIRINGKRYSRNVAPEFRVDTHRKAFDRNPGIYSRALEVLMLYGERRVTVAEMRLKDRDKADALALRLQMWTREFDKLMDAHVGQVAPEQVAKPTSGEFGPAPDVR